MSDLASRCGIQRWGSHAVGVAKKVTEGSESPSSVTITEVYHNAATGEDAPLTLMTAFKQFVNSTPDTQTNKTMRELRESFGTELASAEGCIGCVKSDVVKKFFLLFKSEFESTVTAKENPTRMRGLGDLVASVAQPIARAIDTVAGTKVASCGACKKRQDALNQALPFK